MKNLNYYSSLFEEIKIEELLKTKFGTNNVFKSELNGLITYICEEKHLFSKKIFKINIWNKNQAETIKNLERMKYFIKNIQSENIDQKEFLLKWSDKVNYILNFEGIPKFADNHINLVKEIIKLSKGFVFSNKGEKLKRDGFYTNELELILGTDGSSDIKKINDTVENNSNENLEEPTQNIWEKREKDNINKLKVLGLPYSNDYKSYLNNNDGIIFRNIEELGKRLYSLSLLESWISDCFSNEEIIKFSKDNNIWDNFTKEEQKMLKNNVVEKDQTWKVEGLYTILWCLGRVQTLNYPDEICKIGKDINIEDFPIKDLKNIQNNNYIDYVSNLKYRNKDDILDKIDLYFKYYVSINISNNENINLNKRVVEERLMTFNWIINYKNEPWNKSKIDINEFKII